MSWKPYFTINGKKCFNAQAFETESEARESAAARFMVWTIPSDYGAEESKEPVNYQRKDGKDGMV